MQEYTVQYNAENHYNEETREADFVLLVLPCTTEHQELLSYRVHTNLAVNFFTAGNIFGFTLICYNIRVPFRKFDISVEAHVSMQDQNPFASMELPEPGQQEELLQSADFRINNHLFLSKTELTHLSADVTSGFIKPKGEEVFAFLQAVNKQLYESLSYDSGITHVHSDVNEVWANKAGVCQDYAHLMIALCRANGIPARYVSGYLNQGQHLQGDAQMHAWVEAFVPGNGWVGFDPTNNILADHHYIKVAHGCDYRDCSPIRGILRGGGSHTTGHTVLVTTSEQ